MDKVMDSPLISIVTVCFNAENVIVRTMESVRNQKFQDYEYLIIDGASSDNTLNLVKSLSTTNTGIFSEPDKGIYDAMNKGLKKAIGKYILFLNAGDTFHTQDTLSLFAGACKKNADIIYGDTVIVDKSGKVLRTRHLDAPDILTYESFKKGMLICHQAFMVKRSLAPFYDTKYKFSADYDWTVKCLSRADSSRCQNLRTITTDYLEDGTTDNNKLKSLIERFKIMSNHYGVFPTIINHFSFLFRSIKRGHI